MSDNNSAGARSDWRLPIIAVALVAIAGFLATQFIAQVTFHDDAAAKLVSRLEALVLLAVVVERVVEVYLSLSNSNGPDRHDPTDAGPSAKRPATIASLTFGILIALCGARVLDAVGDITTTNVVVEAAWRGLDVVLSGGLIAGGSYVIHEIIETITGGIKNIDNRWSPGNQDAVVINATDKTTTTTTAQTTISGNGGN